MLICAFFPFSPKAAGGIQDQRTSFSQLRDYFFCAEGGERGEGRREAGGYRPLDRFRAEEGDQFLAGEGFVVFCPILARAMEFQEGRRRNSIRSPHPLVFWP